MKNIKQLLTKENLYNLLQTGTIFSILSIFVLYTNNREFYYREWDKTIYAGNIFWDVFPIILFTILYAYFYISGKNKGLYFQENNCSYLVKSFSLALILKLIIWLYYTFNSGWVAM